MKKKYVIWILSVLLIASWGGNVWYYESEKLEEAIYLKHYYEFTTDTISHMRIYFVTNRDSEREPYQFRLNDGLILNVSHVNIRDERGRLQLKEAAFLPMSGEMLQNVNSSLQFEQATVHYSDGSVDHVSLGEIIIHPRIQREDAIQFTSSGGSSDGTGYWAGTAQENITIASVSHSFPELLSDTLEIHVNGNSYLDTSAFPLTLRHGDTITSDYAFRLGSEDIRRFHAYELMITIKDEQGHTIHVQYISEQPQLYEEDLRSYVRSQKGGELEL